MATTLLSRSLVAAALLAGLGACIGPSSRPDTTTTMPAEPIIETMTPSSDMARITLPPGEPADRAHGAARIACGGNTRPQLVSVVDRVFIYRCIQLLDIR